MGYFNEIQHVNGVIASETIQKKNDLIEKEPEKKKTKKRLFSFLFWKK